MTVARLARRSPPSGRVNAGQAADGCVRVRGGAVAAAAAATCLTTGARGGSRGPTRQPGGRPNREDLPAVGWSKASGGARTVDAVANEKEEGEKSNEVHARR